MTTIHKILIGAACALFLPAMALAATQAVTPEQFMKEIYSHYEPGQPALQLMGADGEKLFDRAFFLLMQQDQMNANNKNEVPWLNGDPVCNCQELRQLKDLKVSVPDSGNPHPIAHVSFTNEGKAESIQFELEPSGDTWRIYDIATADIGSLRAYLAERLAEDEERK